MSRRRYPRRVAEDEDAVAAQAVAAWWEVTGDDEVAQAGEALVAVAEEALARKERRLARERRAVRRREAEVQPARERAARERISACMRRRLR